MNSEPREKIGGLFSNPKISVLPEKCIFTDFNKKFPHEFIGGSDNESNPRRQPYIYTPGIYADGYIVFAFPLVRSSVRMFVSSFVRSFVEFASKFCVKVSQVVYISATTHQKAFIFGP